MQAVMMVAGKSTRTYPLTLTRPKPLLPVLNRPLIFHNLDQLSDWIDEVILIVGYRKEMIEQYVGSEYKGMRVIYQEQKEQLGTGHAVLQAEKHIQGPFLVMNGDDLFAKEDMQRLLNHRYSALALRVEDPSQYGVFQVNERNEVTRLVEKPKEKMGDLANIGCYFFQPEIFNSLHLIEPSERGEIELTSAVQAVAEKEPVKVIEITGYWLPTGFPWDLLKSQKFLFENLFSAQILGHVSEKAIIEGPVHVAENSVIHNNVTIEGPAMIGKGAEIGAGTHIGAFTVIGEEVKIEPECYLENSLVMNRAFIGAGSQIRHSVIGQQVQIGEKVACFSRPIGSEEVWSKVKGKWFNTGLTRLGCVLADKALVGPGSCILPGCKIWPDVQIPPLARVERDKEK